MKKEKHIEIITDFIRSQLGAGADDSDPNLRDVYVIRIELDLSDDSFKVSSNTGNKGLRDGILIDIASRLG